MTIKVDYDDKRGRFSVSCAVWENDRVRKLPNRRWSKSQDNWNVPAIRGNIQAMASGVLGTADYTPAAREKIDSYGDERAGSARTDAFPVYYPFKRRPRDKQMEALTKVYGLHAFALFMDMRTGKTKVLIDLASALRMEGKIDRVILICPLTLRKNWMREFGKDAPFPVDAYLLDSSKPKEFERWLTTPHDFKWLLVGVESLAAGNAYKMVERFAISSTKVLTAIDESSKIKSPTANRSERAVDIGRKSEYRGVLTGTPLAKNPLDLYMQYEFLDPNIIGLGDFYSFRARYAEMGGYERKEVIGYNNLDELIELVSPFTYQVRQHEVLTHTKVPVTITVQMSKEQRALYTELRKKSRIGFEGDDLQMVVQNVLEKALRLQEIVGGHVSYLLTDDELERLRAIHGPGKKLPRTRRERIPGKNPKVDAVLECAELYPGQTIIWCRFRDEIEMVCEALRAEYGHDQVVELHGDIDEAQRDINVYDRFCGLKSRWLVGNAATGGMGLTMSEAENIIYFSNTHNFIDREQSEERGTEDGGSTLIIDIICEGTVDEGIFTSNAEKKDLSEYIRDKITEARKTGESVDTFFGA